MNVYEKLQKCRTELQQKGLKKSGENTHSHYPYFELEDFSPQAQELFMQNRLCGIVSFSAETASLNVIDIDKPEDRIVFTSPMADAKLPGCHPIQNLGAVETYQRRYLYMTALEITENDVLDKTHDKSKEQKEQKNDNQKPPEKPADNKATKAQCAALYSYATKDKGWTKEQYQTFVADLYESKQISSKFSKKYGSDEIVWTVDDVKKIRDEIDAIPF